MGARGPSRRPAARQVTATVHRTEPDSGVRRVGDAMLLSRVVDAAQLLLLPVPVSATLTLHPPVVTVMIMITKAG